MNASRPIPIYVRPFNGAIIKVVYDDESVRVFDCTRLIAGHPWYVHLSDEDMFAQVYAYEGKVAWPAPSGAVYPRRADIDVTYDNDMLDELDEVPDDAKDLLAIPSKETVDLAFRERRYVMRSELGDG